MKTQLIFCLLIIALASFAIHAQTKVEQAWVKHFGSCQPPENNAASAMEVDRFGNVYVTGYKGDSLETSRDFATIKYDTDGVEEWVKLYNNNTYNRKDEAVALVLDAASNVYITGRIEGWSYGGYYTYGYSTIKYNSAGVQRWISSYHNSNEYYSYNVKALFVDYGGNVYVTLDFPYVFQGGWAIVRGYLTEKYNSNGNKEWSQKYYFADINNQHYPSSLIVDILGNVYVTGIGHQSNTGLGGDYATVKYNSIGTQQWAFYYNGPGNSDDGATAIALDDSGFIYVTGLSVDSGTGRDYATIKYNPNGDLKWVARYNNGLANPDDYAVAIAIDKANNIIVTGRSWGSLTSNDYATVKYDRNGVEQWVARYNDPRNSDDFPTTMVLDNEGNIYITGYSLLDTDTTYDYLTVKYNPAGELQWSMRYDHPNHANDYARDIAVDDSGNVYVTGTSYGKGWSAYTTIKYVQNAIPMFAIVPQSVDFGAVMVNSSDTLSVVISNPGTDTLVVSSIQVSDSSDFKIHLSPPFVILPNNQTSIPIVFRPEFPGVKATQAIFHHNAASSPDTIQLNGEAMGAICVVRPALIDFGIVPIDSSALLKINIYNMGNLPLQIFSAEFNRQLFYIQPDSATIAPRDSLKFTIQFKPISAGVFVDTLTIRHNGGSPASVQARGEAGLALFTLKLPMIDFGKVTIDSLASTVFFVYNQGNLQLEIFSIHSHDSVFSIQPGSGSIPPFDSLMFMARFRPNAKEIYEDNLIFFHNGRSQFDTLAIRGQGIAAVTIADAEQSLFPTAFELAQNHPNPFNPETTIQYQLPRSVPVKLAIFDLLGQQIRVLVDERQPAGYYATRWTGQNDRGQQVASGIYFYRLQAGEFIQVRKLTLLR